MFLQQISWQWVILAVFLGLWISVYFQRIRSFYNLKRLGGRAPSITTRWPLGIDFIFHAVQSVRHNDILDYWEWIFHHSGATANGSYTAELKVLANVRVIFTADPENIKAILATQFEDYGKGPQFHSEWKEFLGDSIFTTDGRQWQDSRQMIRPIFTRDRVGDLDIIESNVQKLITHLGSGNGRAVRLDRLLSRFALDASTHFLFGRSVGSLAEESNVFGDAFDEVQRIQGLSVRAGPFQFLLPKRRFRQKLKIMDEFMQPFIQEALALSPSELATKVSKSDTFIHSLARYTRDEKLMRDQLTAILLAGRDTTAATLSWIFLELGRNPRVVEKLRAEIHNTLGTCHRPPCYQEIKDMRYLTNVINETLRLYPPLPYNLRDSVVDTTLPHGAGTDGLAPLAVEKGTSIGYSTLLMQRRKDLYPPTSETFPYDPADWVPERWATWAPRSSNYIPFNGGPRVCIGQQFAMIEMGYTLVRIFQRFDRLVDYGNRPILHAEIILTPGEGVNIGFCNSNSAEK